MKKTIFVTILLILAISGVIQAQDDGPTSNVNIFFVACESSFVLDLTGVAQPGIDIYYQVFSQAGGAGEALTDLRRVSVDGDYAVSQALNYQGDVTIGAGLTASVTVSLASESNSSSSIYEDVVSDIQDGCVDPAHGTVDSDTTGSGATGEAVEPGTLISSSGIFTPNGGVLNPVYATSSTSDQPVVIGAREDFVNPTEVGRTANPGLIFAECNDYPLADPGVIYDIDTLTVFWSWFAATPELVRDHLNNANYSIRLNGQTFPRVDVTPIAERAGNYWVFYTVNLGDKWRPGTYYIEFSLEWDQVISDGYEEFGPGTANPVLTSSCTFTVERNPYNIDVIPVNPAVPLNEY